MAAPAPILFLVGFIITCVGWLFHLIGMATPAWSESSGLQAGVFKGCDDSGENCQTVEADEQGDLEEAYGAVQAMVIIGILLAIAAIIVGIVHIVMGFLGKEPIKILPLVAGILSIVAFVFIIIAVIIWGAEIQEDASFDGFDLGYSFALSIVGAILLLVGGIVMLLGNVTSIGAS